MTARPTVEETWFTVAAAIAQRGTCPRLHVGAVITSPEGFIVTTGYNGSPSGLPHCTEVGCLKDAQGRCKRAVHAEENALLQAAERGTSIAGGTMYVTHQPCESCTLNLLNSGLRLVLYRYPYAHPKEVAGGVNRMIEQSAVTIMRYAYWLAEKGESRRV